jgi:hypothetical protein
MSNRKLLFIEEKGLFSKTYKITLDVSIEEIEDVTYNRHSRKIVLITEGNQYPITLQYYNEGARSLSELLESASVHVVA